MIEAKSEDSCGKVAAMMRPLKRYQEAQGLRAVSEAICGNQQRCLADIYIKILKLIPFFIRRLI
ncbi:hypothetical protein FZC76_11280 [Sutcliffiella horikoshii]|uniref:Uncharacterized protein n=1 Tax=Sutcliffiella horikoshii TaxID=79883 RepID=A0A5D4SY16_9BACI|nr:hypothetical protein FZC76_11280 [Sutcliffiella horikoshii]